MISPGMLGTHWPTVALGDAVDFLDHQRRPITSNARRPGPYPYYGANGQQDSVAEYIFDEPLVLLAEDGGHFHEPSRGVAYGVSGKCWVNNHAHVLRPRSHVDCAYLRWHLVNYDLSGFISGTTRAKLTKGSAERIPLLLPPLVEQKRIAAVLDKADEIRRKRAEAIKLTEELLRSTFLEMFGDPVTNPKGWPVKPLNQFIATERPITYGILKPGPDIADGVPYVRVVDIKDGEIRVAAVRRTTPEIDHEFRRSRLKGGDLLMSIRGHVGRLGVVPRDLEGANITQDTARLSPVGIEPLYLMHLIQTPAIQFWMARHVRGVAVQGINIGDVRRIPVPVPSDRLQQEFASVVRTTLRHRTSAKNAYAATESLIGGLVHRAFRGEL